MRKYAVCLCCILLLTLPPQTGNAQTAPEIAQKAFRSTVLLVMEDSKGQTLSLGSGFFVRDGEIATNFHVVEGATRGYAKLIGQATKYNIEGITGIDPNYDLAILKISGGNLPSLALGDSGSVQVGESIYAVGNPQGLEGTFSQGIISSIREFKEGKLFQMTAPISPGSSGGPVLNAAGEAIGVSVATFKGGQNLNFAIPSIYLKSLLEKTGPAKPLALTKPVTAKGSIVSDLGGRSTKGVTGGQLTWTYSSNLGSYSFSLRNQLRENVRNVYCLVIFYDKQGNPIDVDYVLYKSPIPAGLAMRVTFGVFTDGRMKVLSVDGSVQKLTSKTEIRILNFEIVN